MTQIETTYYAILHTIKDKRIWLYEPQKSFNTKQEAFNYVAMMLKNEKAAIWKGSVMQYDSYIR